MIVNVVVTGALFQCLAFPCLVCVYHLMLALYCNMTNHFYVIVLFEYLSLIVLFEYLSLILCYLSTCPNIGHESVTKKYYIIIMCCAIPYSECWLSN